MRMHVVGVVRCLVAVVILAMFITITPLLADQNTLTLSGNVTAVTRETGPNYQFDTMTLVIGSGSLSFSFGCSNSQGCFDVYWLSQCSPVLTTSTGDPGVTFQSYHCGVSSYRPGRCVIMDGHLIPQPRASMVIVPDSVSSGYGCSW